MAGPIIEVSPPTRRDRTGGLADIATFVTDDRLGIAEDVAFQSEGCEFPKDDWVSFCIAPEGVEPKNLDGIEILNAVVSPIIRYSGVECFAGNNQEEYNRRAMAALAAGRDRSLELQLANWAYYHADDYGATSALGALAIVEQHLDAEYLGEPVIMMSRDTAVMLSEGNALQRVDGVIRTINGTRVAASGGFNHGTIIYGFGAVEVIETTAVTKTGMTPLKNREMAIAEQVYAITVDCRKAVAGRVAGPGDGGGGFG